MQVEIEELEKKLAALREKELNYTNDIENVCKKINLIVTEYQPRIEKIEEERKQTEEEELKLNTEMVS